MAVIKVELIEKDWIRLLDILEFHKDYFLLHNRIKEQMMWYNKKAMA